MAFTPNVRCRVCTSMMVFVQRRGGSEGLWVCRVCAAQCRTVPVEPDDDEDTEVRSYSENRVIPTQAHRTPRKDGTLTRLRDIAAHEYESHALHSSKPSIVYVHAEAFRACKLQMRFMLRLATLVKDDIDLFVLDALTGKGPLAQLGITHAPTLIFRKDGNQCIIEGITPVETLLAVIKSHLGIDLSRREHSGERRMISW